MSYKEPGYHKPEDPPFSFPPEGVEPKIDANLVEIEGRNGTGKTTLLNCLALALGYLDQDKELERKPTLKRKLQDLEENPTLEYRFRIYCNINEPVDLVVERKKGQKRCWLNSKPVSMEVIDKKFEIVFLTEDDPKKVVNSIVGKLSKYFNDLEKGLVSLQSAINKHLMDINEYRSFKTEEGKMLKEIESLKQSIANKTKQLEELDKKLEKIRLKEQIKRKIELLSKKDDIISRYCELEKEYKKIAGVSGESIARKLSKQRRKLRLANQELKGINGRIVQICESLKHYGVQIQSAKLLEGDYSELNRLNKEIRLGKQTEDVSMPMVDDMIALFQRYPENERVPLIEKPVSKVLIALYKIKAKSIGMRTISLITTLNNVMKQREEKLLEIAKIQSNISKLHQRNKDLEKIDRIQNEFFEAQQEYLELQLALQENRSELLSRWSELSLVDGNSESIQKQIEDLKISKQIDESRLSSLQENLNLLRENATKKPKYAEKEDELKALFERISRLREHIFQWIQILRNPAQAKEQFNSQQGQVGFGLDDYKRFVTAVGEYLGNQFEPIAYDYKFHEVKFFDIEKDTFITKEDRHIPINKLSQGQSKIAALTGVLKKMDPNRRKIVLIDEIADLDPENLRIVKKNLLDEYNKGSVILAVLVRPPRKSSSKVLEIKGWA